MVIMVIMPIRIIMTTEKQQSKFIADEPRQGTLLSLLCESPMQLFTPAEKRNLLP